MKNAADQHYVDMAEGDITYIDERYPMDAAESTKFVAQIDGITAGMDRGSAAYRHVLADDGLFGGLPARLRARALAAVLALDHALPQFALPEIIGIVTLSMAVVVAEYESR